MKDVKMKEGYVLVALGDIYKQLAARFIHTLRQCGDTRPVYVIDENILDTETDMYKACKVNNERFNCYPKITLNRYLPFEHNMFVDADSLCIANTQHIWDMCHDQDQFILHRGWDGYTGWDNDIQLDIEKAHGFMMPRLHGAWFYIRKEAIVDEFFTFMQEDVFPNYSHWCTRDLASRNHRRSRSDQTIYSLAYGKFGLSPCDLMKTPVMTHIMDESQATEPHYKVNFKGEYGPKLDNAIPFVHIEKLYQPSAPEAFGRKGKKERIL